MKSVKGVNLAVKRGFRRGGKYDKIPGLWRIGL